MGRNNVGISDDMISHIRKSDALFLAVSALPFSNLGVSLLQVGGRYLPEPYFFAMLFWAVLDGKRRRVLKEVFLSRYLLVLLTFLTAIGLIAGFHENFSFIAFYGRYRAFLTFAISAYIIFHFSQRGSNDALNDGILAFCLGSSLFSTLNLIFSLGEGKIGLPPLAFIVVIYILYIKGHASKAMLFSIVFFATSFLSFWRQNYIISGYIVFIMIIALISSMIELRRGGIRIGRGAYAIISGIIAVSISAPVVIPIISNLIISDDFLYDQSIGKFQELIDNIGSGGGSSERARIDQIAYLLNHIPYYTLPNGLVDDADLRFMSIWGGDQYGKGVSIMRDTVIGYFVVVFGFFMTLSVMFVASLSIFVNLARLTRRYALLLIFLLPPVFGILVVDGLSMTQLQKSPYLGMALAMIVTPLPAKRFRKRSAPIVLLQKTNSVSTYEDRKLL